MNYTIFTTEKYNTVYQWEINNVITQDEVRLPCKLKEDEDMEAQLRETLNGVKGFDFIHLTIVQ